MLRFLVRRLLLTIPVLLGVATLVFALIHLVPGDPVQAMLGDSASPAECRQLRASLGLDRPLLDAVRPLPERARCAGISARRFARTRRSRAQIRERLPATVELALAAMAVADRVRDPARDPRGGVPRHAASITRR